MASPVETPTWDRKIPCGCKGCSVSVKHDRERILFLLDILRTEIEYSGQMGYNKMIDKIKEIVEEK